MEQATDIKYSQQITEINENFKNFISLGTWNMCFLAPEDPYFEKVTIIHEMIDTVLSNHTSFEMIVQVTLIFITSGSSKMDSQEKLQHVL